MLCDEFDGRCLIGVDGSEVSVVRLQDLGENVLDLESENFKSAQFLGIYIGSQSSSKVRTARSAAERPVQNLDLDRGIGLYLSLTYLRWHSGREAHTLPSLGLGRQTTEDIVDGNEETGFQHSVGLIKNKCLNILETLSNVLVG